MHKDQPFTIYSDAEHTWFFLIPQEADLPEGDFRIRTLSGREAYVDPEALDPYVVPRELAEAYLSGQIRETLDSAGRTVLGLLDRLRKAWARPPDSARQAAHPKVDLLADLLGQSPEALRHDPEATKQGLIALFADAALFFDNVKSGDAERVNEAWRQMADVLDLLQWHGIAVDDAAYSVPDRLADLYRAVRAQDESDDPDAASAD